MRHASRLVAGLLVAVVLSMSSLPVAAADPSPTVLRDPAPTGVTADPTPLLAVTFDDPEYDSSYGDLWLTDPAGETSTFYVQSGQPRSRYQVLSDAALRAPGTYTVRAELHRLNSTASLTWTFEYRPDRSSWSQYGTPLASATYAVEGTAPLQYPPPAAPATITGTTYVDGLRDRLDVTGSERGRLTGTLLAPSSVCGLTTGVWRVQYSDGEIAGTWDYTPSCETQHRFELYVTSATGRFAGMTGGGSWEAQGSPNLDGTEGIGGTWILELVPG